MRHFYFLIFVAILLIFGDGIISWSREFHLASRRAFRSQAQAVLIAAKFNEFETARRLTKREKSITLVFVGDVMLSREIERQMIKHNDWRYPFLEIADTLRAADLAFGNLEGPISSRGTNQGSEYSFRARPEVIEGLTYAGFDVLSLANNHSLDWGREALADTIAILKENKITPLGAGKNEAEANAPATIEVGDTKLAFLAYTTLLPKSFEAKGERGGLSSFELESVKNKIREIKGSGDAHLVIVSLHWGEEYTLEPTAREKKIAESLIDAGVDLIVGHHPHVVQEVERQGSWVAYSLGNFVFDQNFSPETKRGLLLKVDVKGRQIVGVTQEEIIFSASYQPLLKSASD